NEARGRCGGLGAQPSALHADCLHKLPMSDERAARRVEELYRFTGLYAAVPPQRECPLLYGLMDMCEPLFAPCDAYVNQLPWPSMSQTQTVHSVSRLRRYCALSM